MKIQKITCDTHTHTHTEEVELAWVRKKKEVSLTDCGTNLESVALVDTHGRKH